MPIPYYGVYSASKAAQHHIGRAMRLELQPYGVNVTTVHPIGTKTEFFDQVKTKAGSAELIEHSPDMFMQTPDFVAACTVKVMRHPKPELWTGVTGQFVRFGMAVDDPDAPRRRPVRARHGATTPPPSRAARGPGEAEHVNAVPREVPRLPRVKAEGAVVGARGTEERRFVSIFLC